MDSLFSWLEAWPLGVWLREATTLWAFPFVLILHTVGLAFLVGVNVAIDLRALGGAVGVPLISMRRYYRAMWAGFWVNAFSGVLLLIAYPTKALTNPVFYLKLAFIAVALVLVGAIRRRQERQPPKLLAAVSILCWVIAVVAGRLLAYTYSRIDATS
jgi:hypothetical protein